MGRRGFLYLLLWNSYVRFKRISADFMESKGSFSGSPFYCFNSLPSGEPVVQVLHWGRKKTVLFHKMTVVNKNLTKSLLSLEHFHCSTLPLSSNQIQAPWQILLRLSLICPQPISQVPPRPCAYPTSDAPDKRNYVQFPIYSTVPHFQTVHIILPGWNTLHTTHQPPWRHLFNSICKCPFLLEASVVPSPHLD